jgi:serine/threonine protein kinase
MKGNTPGLFSDVSFKPQNYTIGSTVAEGGVGAIHQATDLNICRTVAMKVLRDDKTLSREDVLRFVQEAQITGQLEHPNIVPVYELGQKEDQSPYYAMKLIHGTTLEDILDGIQREDASVTAKYPLAMLLTIFEKICDAVAFAHSRGIVHRDLKPGNVMVGEYGEVLVLDWGMAKITGQESLRTTPSEPPSSVPVAGVHVRDSNLTIGCGCILGTPSYMAPEQAANQAIDPRTDIYALGGILYTILALRPPHQEGEVYEMLEHIKAGHILSPLAYNPPPSGNPFGFLFRSATDRSASPHFPHCPDGRIPESLSMIAMKALALKPEDRYQEVGDLQKDIRAYQGGFITSAEARGLCKSMKLLIRRHRTESILIAASLLIILVLTATYMTGVVSALRKQIKAEEDRRVLEAERQRNWRLIIQENFSDPAIGSRWESNGPMTVEGGELRVKEMDQCVRLKTPVLGDVRLVFDCRQESENLSDISCFLSAPRSPLETATVGGYFFQYGGMLNQRISLRGPKGVLWDACASPLIRGRRFHVEATKVGRQLTLAVDGRTVIDWTDEQFVSGPDRAFVGFYNYMTDTRYSNIRVYAHDPAVAADLFDVAESYLARGRYEFAQDLFQQVLDSSNDPRRTERARKGLAHSTRMIRLREEFPAIRARLLKVWPGASVSLGNSGISVDIDRLQVRDLSPLQGLPIVELRCGNNQIPSLEPLKDMKMNLLACENNRISSLEPLRGMPLTELNCGGNPIRDLEPLRGMDLKKLLCPECEIASLAPLCGMNLEWLQCESNQIESLEPLSKTVMRALSFDRNRVSDLGPLRSMPLFELSFVGNQIKDLEPLKGMPLVSLRCDANRIENLQPLKGMKLTRLQCMGNPLKTLYPIILNPPKRLLFDADSLSPDDWKFLEARDGRAPYGDILRDARINRHAKNRDRAALRALAGEFRGHRYLTVCLFANWPDAKRICEELGGHLAVITDPQENEFIQKLVRIESWIGLSYEGQKGSWINGEPVRFQNIDSSYRRSGSMVISPGGRWSTSDPQWPTSSFCLEWDN